jgi:hypothetical protein
LDRNKKTLYIYRGEQRTGNLVKQAAPGNVSTRVRSRHI